jgi:hypothetical protein
MFVAPVAVSEADDADVEAPLAVGSQASPIAEPTITQTTERTASRGPLRRKSLTSSSQRIDDGRRQDPTARETEPTKEGQRRASGVRTDVHL